MKTLAVISARGGSKRLPGKNVKSFLGKPLITWSMEFALNNPCFSELYVSTDCQEISDVAASFGSKHSRLRPAEYATDTATSADVVLDALDWFEGQGTVFDCVALLQPTTPVRLNARWDEAFDIVRSSRADAAVGVRVALDHPYLCYDRSDRGYLAPYCPTASNITRSQDLPAAFCVNGALYLVTVPAFKKTRSFCPPRTRPVLCLENVENIDIDTAEDWAIAETAARNWMSK